jgi:hypothetical protein
MNVDWCKILDYPKNDTTGGWVSENFSAMARLGNWFYGMLEFIPLTAQYTDPLTNSDTWTKTENEKWLSARGLSKLGSSKELKERIHYYIENEIVPAIIVRGQIDISDVRNMIKGMCRLIGKAMSMHDEEKNIIELEAIIRYYLIYYDKIDREINKSNVPAWIKQYNLLCILNIPDVMRNYGTMRNVWEGGVDGESYLKRVKMQLRGGLVQEWQSWVINNLLKDEVYNQWDNNTIAKKTIRKECKVYNNKLICYNTLKKGEPLSALDINGKIYLCYRCNGCIMGMETLLSDVVKIDLVNTYYQIKVDDKNMLNIDNTMNMDHCVGVIFLPLLTNNGYSIEQHDKTMYCMIRSDWK